MKGIKIQDYCGCLQSSKIKDDILIFRYISHREYTAVFNFLYNMMCLIHCSELGLGLSVL